MKQNRLFSSLLLAITVCALTVFAQESKRDRTFSVGKTSSLEVVVSGGDLVVKTWDKNEINVSIDGLDDEDLQYVKMEQSGNTVRVTYRPRWSHWSGGNCRFTMTVPSQCETDLKTSGGDIDLQGNLMADAHGSTSGGDITIERIKASVNMSTSGGDIKTGDIDGKAELRTSGGNIQLGAVNGEANVSTSGGDIHIDKVGKRLDARTSGGDVEVGDIGGDASLSTAGGEVRVGKVSGSATLRTAGGDIELLGASGVVQAKTAGGDISLKDITGSIEAKTAGGNVRAELNPSGKGNSELSTAGGDIKLFIPSSAKATIDAEIRLRNDWGWSKRNKYDIISDFKSDTYEKDPDGDYIRASYKLNGGGETITLETVNGNIEIRKK